MVLKVMLSPVVKLSHGTLATKCHGEHLEMISVGSGDRWVGINKKNRSLHHFIIYQVIVAL